MAINSQITITDFTGQAENPHIGFGANVGVDLYTTKNVARNSRKMEKKSGTLATSLPIFCAEDNAGFLYTQGENGQILKSIDQGDTWTVLSPQPTGINGKGLTVWQDYLWAFNPTGVDLYGPLSGIPSWTNGWTAFSGSNALINQANVNHFPFQGITNNILDICNENYIAQVETFPSSTMVLSGVTGTFLAGEIVTGGTGSAIVSTGGTTTIIVSNVTGSFFGTVTGGTSGAFGTFVSLTVVPFNPGGVLGLDFNVDPHRFTMFDQYNAKTMAFLPTSSIAIAVENRLNQSQADIVIWDGNATNIATNIVNVPGATGPVTNLLTKNGILYGVTTFEAGIYTINGSSAQMVDRLGLHMTNRFATGEQFTTRVQPTVRVGSSDFLGPELLVGICSFPSVVTQISNTGLFPYGIWAVDIENSNAQVSTMGTYGAYTKFPLSHGDINAQYSIDYEMGFVKTLSNGKVIAGWGKSNTFGIDALNPSNYITDIGTVFIESQLFEVGTRIQGKTFNNIYYNLVTPLLTGQEIDFYYRRAQSDPYTLFRSDTSATLGGELGGIITPLPFQQVSYIQFSVRMKADSATPNQTPQLDSIYLN